jgi:cholest-4-en-3-one 26-monooxygenase
MTTAGAVPRGDLMDPSIFSENREMGLFDELRASDPVHWNAPSERGPGFWALTRYRDVKAAAADNARLSSAQGTQIVDRKVEGSLASLHNMDEPEHGKLRKITIPYLRAVEIRQWQKVIDECVTVLLDDAENQGEFDLVPVVSARLPMLVLSRVLGVPAPDAPRMVDWTNRLTSSDPGEEVDQTELAQARDEVMTYFADLTEMRRREPTKDLISVLANGTKDGRPLTWGELAAYYIVLVAAGNETTRHLVSGGTVALNDSAGSWRRLASEPQLLVPAVEEMFRWVSPVAAMRRTALEPLELGGKTVAAGDKVVLWFSAANHDPEMFAQPHEFRVDRAPKDHLTFGWGIHFCLGVHLARAEVRALFAEVLRRGLRFEPTGTPIRTDHNIFRGWQSVPVRLKAATRSLPPS